MHSNSKMVYNKLLVYFLFRVSSSFHTKRTTASSVQIFLNSVEEVKFDRKKYYFKVERTESE